MLTRKKVLNEMRLEFPSLPDNVSFARTTLAMFSSQLEFTLDEIDEIKVAISEVVSNCVIHAYPEETGEIIITGKIYDDTSLEFSITDKGIGISDIAAAMEPAYTTQPEERTGLGLVFVNEYMDDLEILSEVGHGTTVVMRKKPNTTIST